MKRSPKVEFLTGDDGIIHAFALKADYTAEHEEGIAGLSGYASIDPTDRPQGIGSRTSNGPIRHRLTIKKGIAYGSGRTRKKGTIAILQMGRFYEDEAFPHGEYLWSDELITGSWGKSELAIVARGDGVAAVQDLADAMARGDFAMWIGSSRNPFERGALVLAIPSAVPEERKAEMLAADQQRNQLLDDAKATGIIDRIAEAQKANPGSWSRWPTRFGYHALSPGRVMTSRVGDPPIETAHNVMFFLNPMDQKNVNYGWFTVEELDAWLRDEGPVLQRNFDKDAERKAARVEADDEPAPGPRP